MKNYYATMNKIVEKMGEDRNISKITSAGPVINFETKTYLDITDP